MVQIYSPDMLKIEDQNDGSRALVVTSQKTQDTMVVPNGSTQSVWKSGAFTSRDADVYYPIFSRIDIRMKTDNIKGAWHGLWATSYKGASTAEFDLGEFFTRTYGENEVNQTIHLWNNLTQKTEINVKHDGVKDWIRHIPVDGSIKDQYHVYSVDIAPKGENEAVITFLIDGKVSYTFNTDKRGANLYNKFITDAIAENRLETGLNIMFTGGIGGTNTDVLYPDSDVNEVKTTIDYIRVFKNDLASQTEPTAEPTTEVIVEPTTPTTESSTTEPITEHITEPNTETSTTNPVTESTTTESTTTESTTHPITEPVTEPTTTTTTDASTTESTAPTTTESTTDASTQTEPTTTTKPTKNNKNRYQNIRLLTYRTIRWIVSIFK